MTVTERQCKRCNHKWVQRKNPKERPCQCPHCKSPQWDHPVNRSSSKPPQSEPAPELSDEPSRWVPAQAIA